MADMATNKTAIDNAFTGPLGGGSHEPTFSGAPSFMRRRFTKDLSVADVAVWGIPFDAATSNRPGARFGPAAIRRASAIFDGDPQYPSRIDPFAVLAMVDCGDCLIEYERPQAAAESIEAQARQIIDSDVHLISLGGDHFVTLPLLRAHAERHGPLALVQFDAHQDTWDDDGSKLSHGTFVTRAVAEGLIDPGRSIQIGIRSIAPSDRGLEVLDAELCQALGASGVAARVKARVGPGPVYLTFDIDALDPAFAPGTGTPVAGGMSSSDALLCLWQLADLAWVGMDVVEVCPVYDHSEITSIAAATVVQRYVQILALKIVNGMR
ncbi:MAG: agmatinase [Hyphomicrobiales bacterium]|nr:agmatinase [Hyphomicrobiales bacterium]